MALLLQAYTTTALPALLLLLSLMILLPVAIRIFICFQPVEVVRFETLLTRFIRHSTVNALIAATTLPIVVLFMMLWGPILHLQPSKIRQTHNKLFFFIHKSSGTLLK